MHTNNPVAIIENAKLIFGVLQTRSILARLVDYDFFCVFIGFLFSLFMVNYYEPFLFVSSTIWTCFPIFVFFTVSFHCFATLYIDFGYFHHFSRLICHVWGYFLNWHATFDNIFFTFSIFVFNFVQFPVPIQRHFSNNLHFHDSPVLRVLSVNFSDGFSSFHHFDHFF